MVRLPQGRGCILFSPRLPRKFFLKMHRLFPQAKASETPQGNNPAGGKASIEVTLIHPKVADKHESRPDL
jgi:hypothetical protein